MLLERYSFIGLAFSLLVIFLDFYLLRKRKIQGKGFVFWFFVGTTLGLVSIVPSVISEIYIIFGTQFTISSIMATGFLFFLLAIFYLHYKLTELHGLLMKLVLEVSVTKYGEKPAKQDTTNPKSGYKIRRKDRNERKTGSSRRKTSV